MSKIVDPKVTIVIPVYNGSDYLDQAIKSALGQSYDNYEVIVVNDGSNDDLKTEKIALSYSDSIKYIRKENGGVASALNSGIREMSGNYFCWLSHDDIYLPDKLEKQIEFHFSFPDPYGFVTYHDYINIDGENNEIGRRYVEKDDGNIFKYLTYKFPINFCSLLLPKSILEKTGYFDEGNPVWSDHKMLVDIAAKYPFKYFPGFYTKIRKHQNQITKTCPGMLNFSNDSLIYGLNKFLECSDISKAEERKFLRRIIAYTSYRGYNGASDFSLQKIKELNILDYYISSLRFWSNILYKKVRINSRDFILQLKSSHKN